MPRMLEAVEGELCLLEELDVMRCMLLCMLEVPEAMRCVLRCMLEAREVDSIRWRCWRFWGC